MTNKEVRRWKQNYREAIERMNVAVPKRASLKTLKNIWKDIRQEYKQKGKDLPVVQAVVKQTKAEFDYEQSPRDENMNTLPPDENLNTGYEYIENFKRELEAIYNATRDWVNSWRDKKRFSQERREAYLGYVNWDLVEATYNAILTVIDNLILQFGYDEVAQAIAEDVELDYTIALVIIPPSEVMNEMEVTLEQLNGIVNRLAAKYENL